MLAERAARMAARNRGLALGSGRPERAAVTSSRMILVKTLARFLSCAPFRYMMFLNCEWPAIDFCAASRRHHSRMRVGPSGLTTQYGRIGASPNPFCHGFAPPVWRPEAVSAGRQMRGKATADSHRLHRPSPTRLGGRREGDAA